MSQLWGIDIGGTKIEIIVIEQANPKTVLIRERIPTKGNKGYTFVLNQIKELISSIESKINLAPDRIGVGCPGSLDPDTRYLRGSNSQHLNNKPFLNDLETLLGIPVTLENDANCFTLAEYKLGAASQLKQKPKSAFGVILGTGVGGGLVIDGKLISGKNYISGEWGHNFLDKSGGNCYCGKVGCVETVISGPALENYYTELSGEVKSLKSISEQAYMGDQNAIKTIERLLEFFGKGIASVINIIDPDAIIIGGGVGNVNQIYESGNSFIIKNIFSPSLKTEILKPVLGDSAGVFGAALLGDDS